jgi:nitrite reductase (NO-forming)
MSAFTTASRRRFSSSTGTGPDPLRTLHRAAALRIGFGLLWAIDASFKWQPGFIHGQTLSDELGQGSTVRTPVIHQWIQAWHSVASSAPGAFAVGTAVVETCIAAALILGLFSNAVFIGSALYALGIWSGAEAFGLPWNTPGITDVGPAVAYIFASLALLHAAAGATWSLDALIRPKLGPRLGRLTGASPEQATAEPLPAA